MSSCTQQVEYCTVLFPLFTPVATSGVYLTAEAIYKGMAKTGEFRFCKKTLSSCRVDSYTLLPREHRHLGLIEQFWSQPWTTLYTFERGGGLQCQDCARLLDHIAAAKTETLHARRGAYLR